MLCRSCGQIVFSRSKQGVCKKCTTAGRVKEKKIYDRKVWKKFSLGIQEKLTEQYEIILVGKTLKEKVKGIFKRSDDAKRKARREKLKKVFKKIVKGSTNKSGGNRIAKLSRALNDSSHNTNELVSKKREPKFSKKEKRDDKFTGLMGSHPKYDALLSRKGVPKF